MKAFASRTASTSDSPRARPGANGLVELSPFEFLDRLADLVPPPRKHRHRYHGVFAPNHRLRKAVTLLAIGNIGKRRDAATGGQAACGAVGGHAVEGCCDTLRTPGPAPPETHESLISRKTVAEVPLTGLSLTGLSFILLCDYRLTDVHESLVKGILA